MALNAVKTGEFSPDSSDLRVREPIRPPQRSKYDLATAIGIVREMETSVGRAAVYEEIKKKNLIYRLVDTLYEHSGKRVIQPLFLLLYMIKCTISIGSFGCRDAEAVSIANFANEHKTIARISALIPDVRLQNLSVDRKHLFAFGQIKTALRMLGAARQIWSFMRLLVRAHSFMPAARIASTLAFYMRFSHIFTERPNLNTAIIASNYSPESVAMAAAAHALGRRVIYANHAPVPANGPVIPPVHADCALFYGDMTTKIYTRRSACTAEVALIGQPGDTRKMQWRDNVSTIGIFLTSGTKIDVLQSLIATIRLDLPDARIVIRQHPVTLLKTDFSSLAIKDDKTELTLGNPLDEEIAACDLVICGNSGVALNVLSGGRPVSYLSSLDGILFDSNGFVESRLVYSMPWWSEDIYGRLKSFYSMPGWLDVMRSYDAKYETDVSALKREAAAVLMRYIRPELEQPRAKNPDKSQSLVA